MKTLTIFSAVLLPLAFLTGLYGMNFDVLPGKSPPRGLLGLRRRVRRPRRRHAVGGSGRRRWLKKLT